jgi:hypothetical protein
MGEAEVSKKSVALGLVEKDVFGVNVPVEIYVAGSR